MFNLIIDIGLVLLYHPIHNIKDSIFKYVEKYVVIKSTLYFKL